MPRTPNRTFAPRHSIALVLPTGWQLFDGRRAVAGATEVPEAPELRRPAVRARHRDLVPVEDLEPHASAEGDDPDADPEEPQVAGEALIDVLDARTPLLQRAFRNVWPGADS